LLIGFNRLDLFEKILNQVLKVNPRIIYVALDGARIGRDDDLVNINKIKKLVRKISGCALKTNYQKKGRCLAGRRELLYQDSNNGSMWQAN